MPYSVKQLRWAWANKPGMAHKWAHEYKGKFKKKEKRPPYRGRKK